MAETAVGALLVKLGAALAKEATTYAASLLCKEVSALKALFGEIRKAEGELEMMKAYLRESEMFKDTDEITGIFIEKIRGLSLRIEDVVDEFIDKLEDGKHGGFAAKMKKRIKHVRTWRRLAIQLRDINVEIEETANRRERFAIPGTGIPRNGNQTQSDAYAAAGQLVADSRIQFAGEGRFTNRQQDRQITMAEMASSAIVGEVVGRIFSGIINKDKDGSDEGENSSIERLEMACIKLDATIETSNKWQITDVALLRWRKKLKRVSVECEDELRRCKQRSLEDKETKDKLRQSSFPRRVAHSTKSLLSSLVNHQNDGEPSSKAVIRRLERLANGADDFLRLVQLSGAPRPYIFLGPLIRHLFAGKYAQYHMLQRQGSMLNCFSIRPTSLEERGLEAMLAFIHEDHEAPKENFRLGLMLRISESTDVIGITVKCLQQLTPHFNSISDTVIGELTQLPTQDFNWSPTYDEPGDMEHWNQVHDTLTRWFRPNPFCCKQHEFQNMPAACSSSTNTSRLSSIFPEQVIGVFLQRHILPSEYGELQGSKMTCHSMPSFQEDVSLLKLGVLFMLHHPLDDMNFATEAESSTIEAIDGEQQLLDANVHARQLDRLMLPKAVDHLHHNAEATMYQMSWKSKHGSAHLCVEKTSKEMMGAPRATTQQGLRNNSNTFMVCEVERETTNVINLGVTAQRVVSSLLSLALVRTALNARQ